MHKLRRTIPILCLVAASVVAAGIYLVPNHREIALMQMDDFNFSTALKDYSLLHKEGDQSINVLAPLVNLNIYYGDIDKAVALLEVYVADHPHAVEARKKLAELYKNSERFNHYCAVMEELQNLSPSAATLRQLADTYAFMGRNRDEMNALSRLVESKDYEERESDYYKLASFLRVDNQPDEAIHVLRDYIEDKHYQVSVELMYLMIQLLQDDDRESKALAMAKSYLKKHVKEDDAIAMSSMFEARSQYDSAYAVLEPFLTNPNYSTNLEQQQVDVMVEQKKDDDVYTMLAAQHTKQGTLPPSLAVTLTDLAVGRADFTMVEALIRSQDLTQLPEDALLRYADTAFRQKRQDLAQLMLSKLNADLFHEMPALKAVLDIAADDTPKTMAELTAMPRDLLLPPETKIIIAGIYMDHTMPQNAFDLLANIPLDEMLNAFDAAQYADLYLSVNAVPKAEQALAAARPNSTPDMQKSIDQILILFAAGEGKTDFVKQQIASYEDGKEGGIWPEAFDFAMRYHHDDIGLVIAQQLFKVSPTDENRKQLAEALIANHHYFEALAHLQTLVDKDTDARILYLDAIAAWGQQSGGAKAMPSSQLAELNAAVALAIKNPKMSLDERRDLAYVLEDIGFIGQAENVLIAIAGDQPYNSGDVEELLGFWEDHPSPTTLTWVENRIRHSSVSEEVSWLLYLNDNEHPQAVVDILQDQNDLSQAVLDQYVEALVTLHDKDKLQFVLEDSLANETNSDRLKKLAIIADEEDIDSVTEKAWRKVLSVNPSDSDAAKAIGLIDYDAGRYEEAEPLLKLAVQDSQDNYLVNMAYGEILQQDDRKSEAEPYLNRALQQISDIQEKDEATRMDEAYLLYLTDHITESVTLFRQLLAQDPKNKELRADFAEILTETGRFDEATGLLSQP